MIMVSIGIGLVVIICCNVLIMVQPGLAKGFCPTPDFDHFMPRPIHFNSTNADTITAIIIIIIINNNILFSHFLTIVYNIHHHIDTDTYLLS